MLFDIVNWLELTNNMVKDKIIIIIKNLITLKDYKYAIY